MPLEFDHEKERLLAKSTHEQKENFALFRPRGKTGFAIAQVAFDRITKSVYIEREDVRGLIAALSQFAPEVGRFPTAEATAEVTAAAPRERTPLQEFELALANVLDRIASTLMLEGNATEPHPESLVDELLMDIRPALKTAFRAIYLGLRSPRGAPPAAPASADRETASG